jgi:two-component system response regulator AtoC
MSRILIAEDDNLMRQGLEETLTRAGYEVGAHPNAREALEEIQSGTFDMIITDMKMPQMTGMELLEECHRLGVDAPVIMITAFGTIETAVQAMKNGAFDYITKPFKADQIEMVVQKAMRHRQLMAENERLREQLAKEDFEFVVGRSPKMKALYGQIDRIARSDSTVLITGETGVGKEVAAREIHRQSTRRERPFLCVNCAALSAGLLESELFGHEKGAFTGADKARKGRFELADSGTLLLDEVSEISPNLQAKLLRVLQERKFERVGSSLPKKADVRVIATTNRDLAKEMREGRFREDLYFRLNVVPLNVPALRERKEDIADMAPRTAPDHVESAGGLRLARERAGAGERDRTGLRAFPGDNDNAGAHRIVAEAFRGRGGDGRRFPGGQDD